MRRILRRDRRPVTFATAAIRTTRRLVSLGRRSIWGQYRQRPRSIGEEGRARHAPMIKPLVGLFMIASARARIRTYRVTGVSRRHAVAGDLAEP
jgi:hypothetical protein